MEGESMACGEWGSEQLLDYTLGRLAADDETRIRSHVVGCGICRSTLEDLAPFAFPSDTEDPVPGPEVDEAVRNLIRQESERRGGSRTLRPDTRRLRLLRAARASRRDPAPRLAGLVGLAVAASALFALLIVAALRSGPAAPAGRATAVVLPEPRPQPVPPPVPAAAPVESPAPVLPDPVVPAPAPAPRIPDPRPPAPAPAPSPAPVPALPSRPTDTVPAPRAEIARVFHAGGRLDRGNQPLAKGAALLDGDLVQVRSGWAALDFPDGSRVVLRPGAQASLHRSGDDLLIRLADGELACSVTPREGRRFRVEAAHGTVTVLGTVFSVRAGSASAGVAVARGRVEARTEAGAVEVGSGERSSMSRSTSPSKPEPVNVEKQFAWLIETGAVEVPQTVFLTSVSPGVEYRAPMSRGRLFAQGSLGGEPAFGAVDARTLPGFSGRFLPPNRDDAGSITFPVELRRDGDWTLWARLFFPAAGTQLWKDPNAEPSENDPNSFYVSVDGGPERILGNLKSDPDTKQSGYRRWHWGGDGSVEVGRPKGLALGRLAAGRHLIRIRPRDPVETATLHLSPRLDAICLSPDPTYRPRDEDFRR